MSDFKPMMTFGLRGCTAILMVFFTKDTDTVYKVVLGHHPNTTDILAWFNSNYTEDYNIITIVKTPEEYVRDGERWAIIGKNQDYWMSTIVKDNCKLIIEPYSMSHDEYNSTLYFRMKPDPEYTDKYGRYIKLKY
jgi:hypothetical protein